MSDEKASILQPILFADLSADNVSSVFPEILVVITRDLSVTVFGKV